MCTKTCKGFHRSSSLVQLLLRCACSWAGLRVLFYGDSLTAGAPSMCSYAEEFCKCLTAAGCYIEGTVCGLCAASAYEMLEIAQEPFVLDSLQSRWGSGIAHLASQADLVVIMAGTNDLAFADGKHIFKSLHGLHMACHRLGVATVALGIPDSGGRSIKRLVKRQIPAQRREANSLLASWAKGTTAVEGTNLTPEVFVNSVALMPFGPQSRNAGYWETDGVHFTAAGAKVLGYRLAEVLQPLILRQGESCLTPRQPISAFHLCHTDAQFCGWILNRPEFSWTPERFQADCMVAKTSELAAVGEIPSLNAFLEAFDLEASWHVFFRKGIKNQWNMWNWWRVDGHEMDISHKQNWHYDFCFCRMRSKLTMHSMHSQRIETGSCQLFELFKYMRETICTDWPRKKHRESVFAELKHI